MQKYPNHWVAIVNKEVVSAGSDLKNVSVFSTDK